MVEVLTTSPLGALPEIIEAIPQQQCHDITLRSGEEVTQIVELEESSTGELLQQEQFGIVEEEITQPPKQEEYLSVPNGTIKSKVEGKETLVQVFNSSNYIAEHYECFSINSKEDKCSEAYIMESDLLEEQDYIAWRDSCGLNLQLYYEDRGKGHTRILVARVREPG